MRIEDILFFDFTVSYAEKHFFFFVLYVYICSGYELKLYVIE